MFRRFENFHIVLWLMKDACWAAGIKPLGVFMIFPTFGLALWLTFKSRNDKADLYHNLAILCWIAANSTWMIGEFYTLEDSLKPFALVCFCVGLVVVAVYYLGKLFRRA